MAELTLEAKEEIREYLNKERRQIFVVGSASIVAIVTLIGGFLAYVLDDIRDRSVVAANEAIASIRSNIFEPEIKNLNVAVNEAQKQLLREQANLQAVNALVADAQNDIERLASQARTALEELEKAEGSLVFAQKMLEFNSKIARMESQISTLVVSPSSRFGPVSEPPDWFISSTTGSVSKETETDVDAETTEGAN